MLIPVAEALGRILALARPLGIEGVPLTQVAGRVLAADVVATRDQPPFDASAMDGYAVRASEAMAGARLRVVGTAAAGRAHDGRLPEGAAVRIFTGAPVPEGADAILIQENADRLEGEVFVREVPRRGDFIRPRGMDFPGGFRLTAPRRLAPRDVALIASMNMARVAVARRPVVALIPTGDELVEPGEAPGRDQIVSSNPYGLAAMVAAAGALPRLCPIARDDRGSLIASLKAAKGADFIVTLGGASVGEHDLVASVYGGVGLKLDFLKVAMRPGKPLMAGQLGDAVMLGLPGNPVSAMVCGEIFLRPALDRALGLPSGPRARRTGRLETPLEANGGREHYIRAAAVEHADGIPRLSSLSRQDSNLLATLSEANALVVRAPHAPAAASGEMVEFVPLD